MMRLKKNSESNSSFSVVVSDNGGLASKLPASESQPMASSLSTGLSESSINMGCKGERSCVSDILPNRHDDSESINFFVDDEASIEDVVGNQEQAAEKEKIQQDIINCEQELGNLPKLSDVQDSEKYPLIRKCNTLEACITQHKKKLKQLDKPVKRDSLKPVKLENGERKLTKKHCEKLNTVLGLAYKHGKITFSDGQKTALSMVHAILHGYYHKQNVCVPKSVNSCLQKFKNNEWDNSEIDQGKPSRPQPAFWDATAFNASSIVSFDKRVASVN